MSTSHAGSSLRGRVAIVTGASAGIGEAIARAFHAHGASLVLNARRAERLKAVGESLPGSTCVVGDAAESSVIGSMLDGAKAAFGREADLVVVNAGRGLNGSVITSDTAAWEEMVRTNVLGAARLIREAGVRMTAASQGLAGPDVLVSPRDIIVIGSIVGRHVSPFSSMYGGTKFAVHGMVEGVRRELAPKGVRVSLIAPGFVVSEFQDVAGYDPTWVKDVFQRIGPPLVPDDVARTASFIAAQPAGVHVGDIVIRPTRQDYP
ncbi:MAG: SDR family oxidoreductase [Phycisphaerales bacterium]|jgi:NADP-dependent 3-hydroxy acid dehydrogenase YdfG